MSEPEIRAERCPQCGALLTSTGQRVVCAYCSASLVRQAGSDQDEEEHTWGIHVKTISYADPQMDNGEYILSDDPNFDPNRESSQNWQHMERER